MQLHLVGGFLGSGKTTAISAAARQLIAAGKRVGVITNDQGRYLVDTAFMRQLALPAVEVTGGCFCCNYDDLDERLTQLIARAQPDAVFAESVGSCADVVATVLRPLQQMRTQPASLSVFVDSRLLHQRLTGAPMPFADDVVYIFDKQIEEADVLVINKRDLLSAEALAHTAALARARYPQHRLLLQHTHDDADIERWLDALAVPGMAAQTHTLAIDYARYARGEVALAWLDQQVRLYLSPADAASLVAALVDGLRQRLQAAAIPVGHVKLLVSDAEQHVKLSLTALNDEAPPPLPVFRQSPLELLINARAQTTTEALSELVTTTLVQVGAAHHARVELLAHSAFYPGRPVPTHRLPASG